MASCQRSKAFTLIELLITITIIGVMASMVLLATYSAMEEAKAMKTRALIAKLDAIIKAKWESYATRRVPVSITNEFTDANNNGICDLDPEEYVDLNGNNSPDPGEFQDLNGDGIPQTYSLRVRAKMRLDALRDIMRLELPDRWSDVEDGPITVACPNTTPVAMIQRPAVSQTFYHKFSARTPSQKFEGAECLYLIVMANLAEDGDSRDVFKAGDIDDIDQDGHPEFVDGWRRPIEFIRWPVGFNSELNVMAYGRGTIIPTADPHVCEYLVDPATLADQKAGAFAGCVLVATDNDGAIDATRAAMITAYAFDESSNAWKFTCTTPAWARQKLFERNGAPIDTFAVLANDPFDPADIYPQYTPAADPAPNPDYSAPTFASYPLIFSSGPDRCRGIATVLDTTGAPFRYTYIHPTNGSLSVGLNPFYMHPTSRRMMGSLIDDPGEDFFVSRGWLDNIHNHTQGQR